MEAESSVVSEYMWIMHEVIFIYVFTYIYSGSYWL